MAISVFRLIMAGILFGIANHVFGQQYETTMVFRTDMIMILEFKTACDSQVPESKIANEKAFSESRFVNLNIPNFREKPEIGVSASIDPMLIQVRQDIHAALEKIAPSELVSSCARFPAALIEIERKYPDDVLKPYFQ